jgi:peptide deformylase
MYLPIYTYDHPVLKQRTHQVTRFDGELVALVMNMLETMRHAHGIGLAANQVGKSMAATVVDISETDGNKKVKPVVLINPTIIDDDGESTYEEGCLSLPGLREDVVRPERIQVRFNDINMREITMDADGLLARVIQHEIDHLNGIYFFERLSKLKQALVKPELSKIRRHAVDVDYELAPMPERPRKSLVRR